MPRERPRQPARLGDKTKHGGVTGRFVQASANVLIHGARAVRVGDESRLDDGRHAAAASDVPMVLVNRRRIQRVTDELDNPDGKSVQGGAYVLIGPDTDPSHRYHEGGFQVLDEQGEPVANARYCITTADGAEIWGRTDEQGNTRLVFTRDQEDLDLEVISDGPCGA